MRDEQRTTRILSELRKLGVRLCIDDFGTGYSSLSYLRRFALDILKIDRSFVTDMLNNSESQEIVKTILSLGRNLRMKVVAEGVETFEQMTLLKSLGCEFAQGYLFSKPLESAAVARTLVVSETNSYNLPRISAVHRFSRSSSLGCSPVSWRDVGGGMARQGLPRPARRRNRQQPQPCQPP